MKLFWVLSQGNLWGRGAKKPEDCLFERSDISAEMCRQLPTLPEDLANEIADFAETPISAPDLSRQMKDGQFMKILLAVNFFAIFFAFFPSVVLIGSAVAWFVEAMFFLLFTCMPEPLTHTQSIGLICTHLLRTVWTILHFQLGSSATIQLLYVGTCVCVGLLMVQMLCETRSHVTWDYARRCLIVNGYALATKKVWVRRHIQFDDIKSTHFVGVTEESLSDGGFGQCQILLTLHDGEQILTRFFDSDKVKLANQPQQKRGGGASANDSVLDFLRSRQSEDAFGRIECFTTATATAAATPAATAADTRRPDGVTIRSSASGTFQYISLKRRAILAEQMEVVVDERTVSP